MPIYERAMLLFLHGMHFVFPANFSLKKLPSHQKIEKKNHCGYFFERVDHYGGHIPPEANKYPFDPEGSRQQTIQMQKHCPTNQFFLIGTLKIDLKTKQTW